MAVVVFDCVGVGKGFPRVGPDRFLVVLLNTLVDTALLVATEIEFIVLRPG